MESKYNDETLNNEVDGAKNLEENIESTDKESVESTENIKKADQSIIENLEKENSLLKDQLLRTVAESENVRRRAEKQSEENSKFAITSFARDLINAMENLYRATEFSSSNDLTSSPELTSIIEGIEITKKEFISVCEKHGLKRIMPARGEKFDHNIHQAVAHIEDQELESGMIAQIMQAGYTLKERLLLPAMVAVSK